MSEAIIMLERERFQMAHQLAGMAIEFALKAHIMCKERLNSWPSRKMRPELHVHRLGDLVNVAGIRGVLEQAFVDGDDVGLAWIVMKDFDISTRYPANKPFPERAGRDYVEAAGDLGLVEWLITGII